MKKFNVISLLILTTIMLFVWGCTEQPKIAEPDLSFSEVVIPDNYKSSISIGRDATAEVEEIDVIVTTSDGKEVIGQIRFTMPVGDEETLIKFEMTNNILEQTPLTPYFWTEYSEHTDNPNSRVMGIGSCLKDCKGFDKGDGRGACKFGCWAELVLKAATVVVAIIALK